MNFRNVLKSLVTSLALLPISGPNSHGQTSRPAPAPVSFFDPRLVPLRNAALTWELRTGPKRVIIDQVCLVPDVPTFFEAIATWDQTKWFPILIDDVPLTAKFLRAFRPSKVVRFPRKVAAIEPTDLWHAAISAVGKSWSIEDNRAALGDIVPTRLGATPPGLVFSSPTSPSLAGAVALSAGRYQPLVRWEPPFKEQDDLPVAAATRLATELETLVATLVPEYARLGDACDFLTLAGEYPYQYSTKDGGNAFDDLLGRDMSTNTRWAFSGRLLGNARESVYRAMCALFLQPESALLFNTYERNPPWGEYSMEKAAATLANRFQVTHKFLPDARLSDWERATTSGDNFGLIMLNSTGGPSSWTINGGPGSAIDVPILNASVVLTVHSFSAADPKNVDTIAGRWLAGGAFIYFGSMNEPYLNAFRTPTLLAALIDEGLPLGAVMRQSSAEFFGQPWRLVYLGDPLYRFQPKSVALTPRTRSETTFPAYDSPLFATVPRDPASQLSWALKTSILRWASHNPRIDDLNQVLLTLGRESLDPALRPILDSLLIETLIPSGRRNELRSRLLKIPKNERGVDFKLGFESTLVQDVATVVANRDPARARSLWEEVYRAPISRELKTVLSDRLIHVSETSGTLADWRTRLQVALREAGTSPDAELIREILQKVEAKLKAK